MNDSDDDQPAAIASAFASLKKGAARAGPAPPRTTGAYALPSIPALYANVSEATLDDAKEREKARNASLIKPNRLTQRAAFTKTWPAPNFPRLKKRLEVHVPLPRHLAWTGLRSNRYAKDDPVLRFVPYFGDDDATGIDVAAYDNEDTQAAPRPSEGLVWAAASDDVAVCTCGEDPRAITAALDAARSCLRSARALRLGGEPLRLGGEPPAVAALDTALCCIRSSQAITHEPKYAEEPLRLDGETQVVEALDAALCCMRSAEASTNEPIKYAEEPLRLGGETPVVEALDAALCCLWSAQTSTRKIITLLCK